MRLSERFNSANLLIRIYIKKAVLFRNNAMELSFNKTKNYKTLSL